VIDVLKIIEMIELVQMIVENFYLSNESNEILSNESIRMYRAMANKRNRTIIS